MTAARRPNTAALIRDLAGIAADPRSAGAVPCEPAGAPGGGNCAPDVERDRAAFVDLLHSAPCDRCGRMLGSMDEQMFHPETADLLCRPCAQRAGVAPVGPVHGSDEEW